MVRVLASLAALCAAAAAQAERVPVRLDERLTAEVLPLVTFPQERLALSERRPGGLDGVPKLEDGARYCVAELGARKLPLAFAAPKGAAALGLLYTGGGEPAVGRLREAARGFIVDFADVPAGGLRVNVRLHYAGADVAAAGIQLARHRRGRAVVGGVAREVILVDADADGAYDGPADRWVALRTDRVAQTRNLDRAEALLLREPQIPFEADGRALHVDEVARDGATLVLALEPPRAAMEAVRERGWGEVRAVLLKRLRKGRALWVGEQAVDAKRPRTFSPAAWPREPLSRAQARARAEGKPLLALYVTESNPWCFRYEFYTFPDKEVDALLQRFARVVIDAEKDPEQSYVKSGARGTPALVPLTADGRPVRFKVLVRDESGLVKDFAQPENALHGWQRPEELVVNLKRMLEAAK